MVTMGLCHFCEVHGPVVVLCTRTADIEDRKDILAAKTAAEEEAKTSSKPVIPCNSCSAFTGNVRYLVTTHSQTRKLFFSCGSATLAKADPGLARSLRTIAFRSLSVEVPDQKASPVIFDSAGVSVLSKNFELRDSHHRGGKRSYSVVVMTGFKPVLVTGMRAILGVLDGLIGTLTSLAESNYDPTFKLTAQIDPDKRRLVMPALKRLSEFTSDSVYETVHQDFSQISVNLVRCARSAGSAASKTFQDDREDTLVSLVVPSPSTTTCCGRFPTPIATRRGFQDLLAEQDLLVMFNSLLTGDVLNVVSNSESFVRELCDFCRESALVDSASCQEVRTEKRDGLLVHSWWTKRPQDSGRTAGDNKAAVSVKVLLEDDVSKRACVSVRPQSLCAKPAKAFPSLTRRAVGFLKGGAAVSRSVAAAGVAGAVKEYENHARTMRLCRVGSARLYCQRVGLKPTEEPVLNFLLGRPTNS